MWKKVWDWFLRILACAALYGIIVLLEPKKTSMDESAIVYVLERQDGAVLCSKSAEDGTVSQLTKVDCDEVVRSIRGQALKEGALKSVSK